MPERSQDPAPTGALPKSPPFGTDDGARRSVLVVDDEDSVRESVARILRKEETEVRTARSGEEALELIRAEVPDLLLTDFRMPGMDGIELLVAAKRVAPEMQVIVMTAFGTVESAVRAMKEGADDFIEKPLSRGVLVPIVMKALERRVLVAENRILRDELERTRGVRNVVGQSSGVLRILNLIQQVAPTTATVLIQGETGTGKEVIARAIHQLSLRRDKPFVTVNAAALPETLIESELFGYEKGAFTGATGRRIGRFQQAHTGTLLLDEVAEMVPHVQVKLLRAIQESTIEPLGGSRPIPVDVRLIAATNQDLERAVENGSFREELYYRLNVVRVELPPLRQRREDIPLLVHHFVRRYSERNERPIHGVETAAMRALTNYHWPGNVRQLEHVIERAVILSTDSVIAPRDLPPELTANGDAPSDILHIPLGSSMDDIKSAAIQETLRRAEGNKKLAAKMLRISSRTVHRWVRDHEGA